MCSFRPILRQIGNYILHAQSNMCSMRGFIWNLYVFCDTPTNKRVYMYSFACSGFGFEQDGCVSQKMGLHFHIQINTQNNTHICTCGVYLLLWHMVNSYVVVVASSSCLFFICRMLIRNPYICVNVQNVIRYFIMFLCTQMDEI